MKFLLAESKKNFKKITGTDVFFKSIYPKCYKTKRKKYGGVSLQDKVKFFKFLVLENKLTNKEIILVLYNLILL